MVNFNIVGKGVNISDENVYQKPNIIFFIPGSACL